MGETARVGAADVRADTEINGHRDAHPDTSTGDGTAHDVGDEGLFRLYRRDADASLRDALVERHLGLVRHAVRRFTNKGEPFDDLFQVGVLALIKAVDGYDPDRGVRFSTYGTRMVEGEIKRHFRDKCWTVHVPRRLQELQLEVRNTAEELTQQLGRAPATDEVADAVGVSPQDVSEAMSAAHGFRPDSVDAPPRLSGRDLGGLGEADPAYEQVDLRASVAPHLRRLSRRDREILRLRFGHGLSQAEIGGRVGLSQIHVSRRIRWSLEFLQSACSMEAM
jgi:RNA polymerase sigma-B factor